MGAILRLHKMPANCRECPFASKDVKHCNARNSEIIAGTYRKHRMPLCPLRNEGDYLTSILKSGHNPLARLLKRYRTITITLPEQSNFTDKENSTYSEVLTVNSVDTGINLFDTYR